MADEKKSIAVQTVDKISDVWHEAMDSSKGISLKNIFHSAVQGAKDRLDKVLSYFYKGDYDDNINILENTKTLTGQDFSELYDGEAKTVTKQTDNGDAQFLEFDTPYSTDMYQYGTQSENTDYDALSLSSKVIYETTMITKKFANRYASKLNSAEDTLDLYKNEMDKYKSICESNNISWNDVMMAVSNEVQTESYHFIQDRNEADLNISNLSHNLLLAYAGSDFEDIKAPDIGSDGVTYENTLSLDNEFNENVFDKIKRGASQGVHKAALGVGNLVHKAWDGIEGAAHAVKEGIEGISNSEDDYEM